MHFELIISRIGALAGTTSAPFKGRKYPDIIKAFERQLRAMLRRNVAFDQANAALIDQAPQARCIRLPKDNTAESIQVYKIPSEASDVAESKDKWTWVGILPSLKMKLAIDASDGSTGMDWILRARCSVTACVLHNNVRQSKIWLTIEGIPANGDPLRRPTEQNIADFISLSDKMEAASMELFHSAYKKALERSVPRVSLRGLRLSKPRIRVRMTDTTDPRVSELLNLMYSGARSITEIREGGTPTLMRAQRGLQALESLLRKVEGREVPKPEFQPATSPIGPKGAFYRTVDRRTKDTVVVGLSLQLGTVPGQEDLPPEKRMLEMKEAFIRDASAARPISADIAQTEALKLERRLAL